jgi:hypothetical protein
MRYAKYIKGLQQATNVFKTLVPFGGFSRSKILTLPE